MSLSLCLFGLLLGMRHALEPDHLAAVSTLVVTGGRARSGAMLGGLWGLGHTTALLAVATLLALAGASMPAHLTTLFELGVALMLIGIGFGSLTRGTARTSVERDSTQSQVHAHRGPGLLVAHPDPARRRLARRSLLVGSVHGLAGSGALTALVASRLPSTPGRLVYVALFGLGSIVGMTLLSGAAGWPLARLSRRPILGRILTTASGVVAFGLGVAWGVPLIRDLAR